MTNTDTADVGGHRAPGGGAGARRQRARARDGQQRRGRRGRARDRRGARPDRRRRADHRRLPLQRPPAAHAVSRVRAAPSPSTASIPATSAASGTTRTSARSSRSRSRNDKPVRIGVNWGSLDQSLLTEMMDANARRAEPRDARDVTMEAMVESALRVGRARRGDGHGARPDHPQRQGVRRAGPGRRLPDARRPLRLPAAPRASPRRGSAPRASSRARRASASSCRRASATRSASRSRPRPAATGPRRCRSRSRCCSRSASGASRRR